MTRRTAGSAVERDAGRLARKYRNWDWSKSNPPEFFRSKGLAEASRQRRVAPPARVEIGAMPAEYSKKLTQFVRSLSKDVKVTVTNGEPGDRVRAVGSKPLRMILEVPGAKATYVFESPSTSQVRRGPAPPFGSRAWGYEMAYKLRDFVRAHEARNLGDFLAWGNAGGIAYDGTEVVAAVRRGEPAKRFDSFA